MTKKRLLKILDDQGFRCALSGRSLSPETASIDHVLPISRGGEHDPDNAQIVDMYINQAKSNMTNDEFIAMCCEVADWNRSRSLPSLHGVG